MWQSVASGKKVAKRAVRARVRWDEIPPYTGP